MDMPKTTGVFFIVVVRCMRLQSQPLLYPKMDMQKIVGIPITEDEK